MLPQRLNQIRSKILQKEGSKRSSAENQLLQELDILNSDSKIQTGISESAKNLSMIGPSSDNCPACGRSY